MPQRSNVPVRKFSMTTSDLATNFFKISFPFFVRKSNVNDFLFLASAGQRNGSSPLNGPICLKLSPVLGISILITSAPKSPNNVAPYGAAIIVDKSKILTPAKGPLFFSSVLMLHDPFPKLCFYANRDVLIQTMIRI